MDNLQCGRRRERVDGKVTASGRGAGYAPRCCQRDAGMTPCRLF